MLSPAPYRVPSATPEMPHRIEIEVVRSRFIATVMRAATVEVARSCLAQVRAEMPDANHHVYAFRVGYGTSVTEGMSDDGEPTGTAGPPVLSVVRGTAVGDLVLVVTRYFGGTKLGTGGLVRAYSEAAHAALETLPTELKIERQVVGLELPYPLYQPIRKLVSEHQGDIQEETFSGEITLFIRFPLDHVTAFMAAVQELSAGQVRPVILE